MHRAESETRSRESLRRWLRAALERNDWSGKILAAKAGVDESTVSRALNGKSSIGWNKIVALAAAAGCDTPSAYPATAPGDGFVPLVPRLVELLALKEPEGRAEFRLIRCPLDLERGVALKLDTDIFAPDMKAGDVVFLNEGDIGATGDRVFVELSTERGSLHLYRTAFYGLIQPDAPALQQQPDLPSFVREDEFCLRIVALFRGLTVAPLKL